MSTTNAPNPELPWHKQLNPYHWFVFFVASAAWCFDCLDQQLFILARDNALKALEMIGSGTFLPIHWGTFNLALHAWDEPAETLAALVEENKVPMVTPRLGAPIEPSRVETFDPWWREVK